MVSASAYAPVPVLAHGGATGIVKERMDAMGMMGKAVKGLKGMMQGKAAYNADLVRKQSAVIKQHSGEALIKGFPEGSTQMPSEAKNEIWMDWERFSSLAEQLGTYAGALEMAADNGLMKDAAKGQSMGTMMGVAASASMGKDMMGKAMGVMGGGAMDAAALAKMPADAVFTKMVQVCSACHTDFRLEKKK
ncbi:MAG TPA: cytochrome C [Rhizobiales bacterium]|nr:cytochrome C [Hyphomicrobiales bacterium]